MSLELAISENTQALRDLIAALSLRSPGAVAYAQAKGIVDEPPSLLVFREPPTTPSPYIQTSNDEHIGVPVAAEPAAPTLSYDDIKIPFLTKLVAKHGREAGAALLREFGVADGGKLSDIPQAQWAAVLESINVRCGA